MNVSTALLPRNRWRTRAMATSVPQHQDDRGGDRGHFDTEPQAWRVPGT